MNQLQTIIVVSHTHWDREWYRTFQEFRFHLVDTLDRLLDLLADRSDFAYMLLDGQSVLLEDYLAIRPERTSDIRRLVRQGRLGLGPWYVQPDEFLVSGEALIRNLTLGHRVAQRLGSTLKVGWLPDTFGHVAQLPQILRGFDIDTFVSTRGLGNHLEQPALEFWWEAPDGSRVLALHQYEGYYNAGNLGYPYFWGETRDHQPDTALAIMKVKELAADLGPLAATPTLAIWNGADHMPAQESLPDVIAALNEGLADLRVKHGRVEDYAQAVRDADPDLQTVGGELRGSRYQNVHAPVLSSRIHLKQANHQVQRLLERYAEPLAAAAWLAGDEHPGARLWEAWRLLLQNHPHDSICGCSVDEVHREMVSRFDQARQIGNCAVESAFGALAVRVDTSWSPRDGVPILLFNPLGQSRDEVVEISLRLPAPHPCRVTDHLGREAEVDMLSTSAATYPWMNRDATTDDLASQIPFLRQCFRQLDGLDIADYWWETAERGLETGDAMLHLRMADWPFGSDEVADRLQDDLRQRKPGQAIKVEATTILAEVALKANLPPCGYAAYAIELTDEPLHQRPSTGAEDREIENELLRVEVDPRGRLTLVHRPSGCVLKDLHQIEDTADCGDCYDYCPLPLDQDADVMVGDVEVETVRRSGLVKTLSVAYRVQVPASLAEDGKGRSREMVDLPVRTLVKLRAGSPYVELLTTLDNRARDHRVRVLFPSGLDTDTIHADGHFMISSRAATPMPAEDWHQPPSDAQPHHTWFGADDGREGLAVLSEGLPEHAGLLDNDGLTLALTLLRGVGWLSRGGLCTRRGHSGPAEPTPDAQCLGTHAFRYGLLPYEDGPLEGSVPTWAARFDTPPVAHLTASGSGNLPPRRSIVSLAPETLILTALKKAEEDDRLLLRFYSVARSPVQASIQFGFRADEAFRATTSESVLEPLQLSEDGSRCTLEVKPAEIVTIVAGFRVPLEAVGAQ